MFYEKLLRCDDQCELQLLDLQEELIEEVWMKNEYELVVRGRRHADDVYDDLYGDDVGDDEVDVDC